MVGHRKYPSHTFALWTFLEGPKARWLPLWKEFPARELRFDSVISNGHTLPFQPFGRGRRETVIGRALAQARGRRFDSCRTFGSVAQSKPVSRTLPRLLACVAQTGEHAVGIGEVSGSIPLAGSSFILGVCPERQWSLTVNQVPLWLRWFESTRPLCVRGESERRSRS